MNFTFTRAIMKSKKANPINSSAIGARNQRKFAPNPSPIRIRIPTYASVSIWSMTFDSYVQSR